MRRTICFLGVAIVAILVLNGCGQSSPDTESRDNVAERDIQTPVTTPVEEQDTISQIPEELADMRRPDMKVRVRKGSALCLETEGFQLVAVDTAVKHTREYSVTSLQEEDLAPLPQGMKNMTAASAGYRLLPSGVHFSPYAELHVAYDPERLPFGYTPEDIYTSYYDTATMAWVRLERLFIDTVNHEIVSATTHFTDFINELLKAPEMPETQAFVPTQMSDLEAVNPLEGKPLMQPPTANAEGTANLSYPIWTPAGRAGMQPNLTLTYNSAGGNGWLGVGWDISVPSITLDTRWGVPCYDNTFETEIYLLGGEQLVTKDNHGHMNPMPHRTNHQTHRLPDRTRFFARTGDAHDSIIRHNDRTDSYWWEVVDRTGTTHYYGHYPDVSRHDLPITLHDNKGNIARWMLCESRDPYGNWIRYFYDTVSTGGTNPGIQIYLDSISYTGHYEESGVYSVVFKRKLRDPDDWPVSCCNGFKEETSEKLLNIYVKTRDTIITYYTFETECTYKSNYKTRLTSVSKKDVINNRYTPEDLMDNRQSEKSLYLPCDETRQEFEYYDAPPMDTLFGPRHEMAIPSDELEGFMLTPNFIIDSVKDATALGLSHTSSWNVSGTIGAGLGYQVWNTDCSVGGNYSRGGSSSEAIMSLVDLNGDGLADKVFMKGGKMWWRKRLWSSNENISYDEPRQISGANHFLVEENTTSTFGVQAAVSVASGSGAWSNSVSTTSIYFADVDGDGLTDIVDGGNILFNQLNNGQPTFIKYELPSPSSSDLPHKTSSDCGGIIFDGEVNRKVPCRIVWGKPVILGPMPKETAFAACSFTINDHHVEKVEAKDSNDSYYTYSYTGNIDCSRCNLASVGMSKTEAVRVWVAPESGTVSLRSYVRLLEDRSDRRAMSSYADGVIYTIQLSKTISVQNDILHSIKDSLIISRTICASCYGTNNFTGSNYDFTHTFEVNEGDILFFRLQSNEDMQFDNVEDHIKITLNNKDYLSDSSFLLTEDKYFKAPYGGHYIIDGDYINQDNTIDLKINQSNYNGPSHIYNSASISEGDSIYFSLVTTNNSAHWHKVNLEARIRYWSDSLPDTITIWTPGDRKVLHPAGSIWGDTTYQRLFGVLYNGWGQFAYHPIGTQGANALICPSSLVPSIKSQFVTDNDTNRLRRKINNTIPDAGFSQSTINSFIAAYGSQYSIINDSSCWVGVTADAEHERWVAFGAQNNIGFKTMSNSIQEDWYSAIGTVSDVHSANLYVGTGFDAAIPPQMGITPTKAVNKVNLSNNQSYTIGVEGLTASHSTGQSCIDMDYLDLNGDRYPDIVGTYFVQYRSQWGGLGDLIPLPHDINDVTVSTTNSEGSSFGASLVSHERAISSRPAKAKFSLNGDGSSGGSFDIGGDRSTSSWTDMNGDGLPDYVNQDGKVRLNTGYDFLVSENWHFDSIHSGQSISAAANVGGLLSLSKFNVFQGSIQLGAGLSRSVNRTKCTFIDVNGDGLPDMVWRDAVSFGINSWDTILNPLTSVHVRLNKGRGQWSPKFNMNIKNFGWSETHNESLNAGATIGVTFWGIFKLTAGISGTPYSSSVNRDRMQLVDVNGDGLPDLVTSHREDSIFVRYNRGGKTNLLKMVTNFTGSRIYLDYALSAPDYNQPSRSWQLTKVTTKDPLNPNGSDTTTTQYSYREPHYDRLERTFYGYGSVVTNQVDPSNNTVYRTTVHDFYNDNILIKGRPKRDTIKDGNNNIYIVKEYHYGYASYGGSNVDTCSGNAYSLRDSVVTKYFEGDVSPKLTSAEVYIYDQYHNVTRYIDKGDLAYSDDGLYVEMTYLTDQDWNLVGLRDSYVVYATGATGQNWLRYTSFQYNTKGKMTHQELQNTASSSMYDFEYDGYGNLSNVQKPKNDSLQRMTFNYTYDGYTHTYPTKITNSFLEEVNTEYIHYLGRPIRVTDPAGSSMHYSYDYSGRLVSVTSPISANNTPTLTNEYYPTTSCIPDVPNPYNPSVYPFAVTKHYDDQGNLITETVVITDGFGRVIQTKKGITTGGQQKMQVSGRMFTDAFGRVTGRHDPFCENRSLSLGTFNTHISTLIDTIEYDVLDRETEIRQPSMNYTTTKVYDVQNDLSGHRRFTLTVTDPNIHTTVQYFDYDGRQVQVTDALTGNTRFTYDAIGQLLTSTDPENFATTYTYDKLGQMTARAHPDAGLTEYSYDDAGNITRETNALGNIQYAYTFQRLAKKFYSNISENNVTYTYGGASSGTGRGRLTNVADGTGECSFVYDALGNVTTEVRTIAVPNATNVYTFTTEYVYDSWGRMRNMTYPDGEIVSYNYGYGGDLLSMIGDKEGGHYHYVIDIVYNDFGQRHSITYGNGTSVEYFYDALHRLNYLRSVSASGDMQRIDYTLDGIGNIGIVRNNAYAVNGLGGPYTNTYIYDDLNRLISSGETSNNNYSMLMTYSPSGRLAHKKINTPTLFSTNINAYYGYCSTNQPHAPKRIYDSTGVSLHELLWDNAGNLGQVNNFRYQTYDNTRFLFWTEDNRLHTVADNKFYSYYAYDHAGERTLKLTGTSTLVDINANIMEMSSVLSDLTMYPSPYMVLSYKGYTKHYYIGADRLCARIGGGGLASATQNNTLSNKASCLLNKCVYLNEARVLNKDLLECIHGLDWDNNILRVSLWGAPNSLSTFISANTRDFNSMITYYSTHSTTEDEVYYYHGDHLGGANWITDAMGRPVQHLQYLPFGENYINQRATGSTYQERYTFTGKEKDEETGYGYFGARYMDYELLTSFISVDRYASKYPSISPYAYCAWNPLRLIDPNGDSIALSEKAWGIMEQAIKSTLLQKNKNIKNPFYYRDGHVHYDESISFNTNDEKLQEIHNHFKELTTDKNYKVEIDLVSNDTKFDAVIDEEWTQTTLKREGAYGFSQPNQEKTTGCHVYISNHPLHSNGTPYAQSDDFMSLSFLHEVGGHAYNWKNNIYGSSNNRNTEWFERICRDVFKGKYGNSDVHNGKVKIHAL